MDTYDGSDIIIFNDKKNFYSWQKDIYDIIYNEDGSLKTPDPKAIISLVDFLLLRKLFLSLIQLKIIKICFYYLFNLYI